MSFTGCRVIRALSPTERMKRSPQHKHNLTIGNINVPRSLICRKELSMAGVYASITSALTLIT